MFRLDADKRVHFCDGVTRRDFVHAGSLAFLGLSMPQYFQLKAAGAVKPDKDVSCIQLMLVGGPSQLDTWDMKPEAPASIRGPFKPIKTNVSGIKISEIFPRMAKHADKFALLRSVYHTAAAVHDTGCQMMLTGRLFQGGLESPNYGSVLRFEKGARGDMLPNVLLPYMIGQLGGNLPHGDTAGFLGKGYDPFVLNADPADPDFKVPDMLPPEYISAVRVDRRRSWRQEIDKSVAYFEETNQDSKLMDATFNQAYTLMTSAKAREAFELTQEPRLTLRDATPDYRLKAEPENPNIPRGGSTTMIVSVIARRGAEASIEIEVKDLPAGVSASPATIFPGQDSTVVVLTAGADAPLDVRPAPIQVIGHSMVNGHDMMRTANRSEDGDATLQLASITPPPDVVVTTESKQVSIEPGKEVTVTLHVDRHNGFKGRVPCFVQNLPPGVRVVNVGLNGVLVTEAQSSRTFTLRAEDWAKPISQPIYVVGIVESNSPTMHPSAPVLLKINAANETASQAVIADPAQRR